MGPTTGFQKGHVQVTHVAGACRGAFTFDDQGVGVYEYDQNEVCETLECLLQVEDTSNDCCTPAYVVVTILPPPAANGPCIQTEEVPCEERPQCSHCNPGTDVDCDVVPSFAIFYDQETSNPHIDEAVSLIFTQPRDLNFTDVECRYTREWQLTTGGEARASLLFDADGIHFEFRVLDEHGSVIGRAEFYQVCANIECDRRYGMTALPAAANGTGSFNGLSNETNWEGATVTINPLAPLGTC